MRLNDYPVFDLTGGVRRDKSDYQLQDNEVSHAVNFEFREKGRTKRRRGFQQTGTTFSGIDQMDNMVTFIRDNAGSVVQRTFANNRQNASTAATMYVLRTTRLTAAIATSDSSITVADTSNFAASGTIEIEGDIITYTAIPDGTHFTVTSSTILRAHVAGAAVNQWRTNTGTLPPSQQGIEYVINSSGTSAANVNNVLMATGAGTTWAQIDNADAETISAVTGEPGTSFTLNYRLRLYGAGAGGTTYSPRRMYYSGIGNGTSWSTSTDYFDVVDDRGEYLTGGYVLNDTLWLFKTNSIHSFDETELKQRQGSVGAYNQRVIQEIEGLIYTFCPTGIYTTNGFSVKEIGLPVHDYWKLFMPRYEGTGDRRVVVNTFSAVWDRKYILYIGNITTPSTMTGVALVYDTVTKAWEIWDNLASFTFLKTLNAFQYGDSQQYRTALFGGDASRIYRFFENRYLDGGATPTLRGRDLTEDNISDSAGEPIAASFETKLYHLNSPHLMKGFHRVRLLAENPGFNLAYRIENEKGISEYKPLGQTSSTNHVFSFPSEARGYRVGYRVSHAEPNVNPVFNGLIIEDTDAARGTN